MPVGYHVMSRGAAAATSGREIVDFLLATGQSNATDLGDAGERVESNGLFWNGSALVDLTGQTLDASLWPALADGWFERTGRRLVIARTAQGGTGLLDAAGGQWGPSGTLRDQAVTNAAAAIAAINASGTLQLGSVNALYVQGEADAASWNGTTVTGDMYRDALIVLGEYLVANVAGLSSMHVTQIPLRGTAGGLPGIFYTTINVGTEAVREAQYEASVTSSAVDMAYEGEVGALALGRLFDGTHMNQTALNETGYASAYRMTGGAAPAFTVPSPLVAATAYTDANTAAKSSRTISHTTTAGVDGLTIVTVAGRYSAGSYQMNVTVNGVSARRIANDRNNVAGVSGLASTNLISVHHITAAELGASLSSASLSIVATSTSGTVNSLHAAMFETQGLPRQAGQNGQHLFEATTLQTTIHAATPMLGIVISAATAEDGSAFTLSQTDLATELVNADHTNATATRRQRYAIGYTVMNTGDDIASTVTASVATDSMIVMAIGMRPQIDGETV